MRENRWKDRDTGANSLFHMIGSMSLVVVLIVVIFEFIFIRLEMGSITAGEVEKEKAYEKHYVLIVDELEDPFWRSVYEAAKEEGKKENIYVEYLGEELAERYTVNERLKIAIASRVDGILVAPEGEASEELLAEAMKEEIGVVTLLNDSMKGNRNSFVGVNSSSLGSVYGQEINRLIRGNGGEWEIKEEDEVKEDDEIRGEAEVKGKVEIKEDVEGGRKPIKRVMILMDDNMVSANQNMIYLGIKEAVGEGDVEIETKVIDSQYRFSAEESIRNIILKDNARPDVLVCLSAVDTLCAYQALVDYNKVGEINIIGYYESQGVLEGIGKQVIYSTVSIDSLEMGRKGVQALREYEAAGSVNAYFTVETRIIDKNNVGMYLMKEDE